MYDAVVISELSRHTLKSQKEEYPGGHYFLVPDDVSALFRKTQRKKTRTFHVLSLAVISDNEDDFKKFVHMAWDVPAFIESKKESYVIQPKSNINNAVNVWKKARREGAAKAGGDAKSNNSLLRFWEGFSKIKDRWHLDENSKGLMKEAGIKHHDTVRANLGHTRWEWRKFSDAKRARVLKQLEKEVRERLKNQ
jgi:glutaredoxin-related protein